MAEVDTEEELVVIQQAILLAEDAKTFLESPLYEMLENCAQAEVEDALQALRTIDPTDTTKILQLQSDIKRAESFPSWIRSIILEGDQAYDMYRQNLESQTE